MGKRTPLEVEILIHYYVSRDIDFRNLEAPAIQSAINEFVAKGLLLKDDSEDAPSKYFGNREVLEMYVNEICSVPLPKQKWVIEK
jgi:hypothetical protein